MENGVQPITGLKVLVVEDEALIALATQEMLADMGCVVIGPAPTVKQALELLDREEPEFAILDVNLRRERATPVAEALQKLGIPFVLATACSRSQLLEQGLQDAQLLGKPIDCRLLYKTLSGLTDYLGRH